MADDDNDVSPRVLRLFRLFQRSGRSRRFERGYRSLSRRDQDDLIQRIGEALLRLYRHEGRTRRFNAAYRQIPRWQQRELAEEIRREYQYERNLRQHAEEEVSALEAYERRLRARSEREIRAEEERIHPPIESTRILPMGPEVPPEMRRLAPELPRERNTAEQMAVEEAALQKAWGYDDEEWRALKMRWYLEHYGQEPELSFERFLERERYGRHVGHAGNRWPGDRIAVFDNSDGAFNFIRDRLDPKAKVFISATGYLRGQYKDEAEGKIVTKSLSGPFRFAQDIIVPQRMEAIQDMNRILFELDPYTPAYQAVNKWIVRWKNPGDRNYKNGRPR